MQASTGGNDKLLTNTLLVLAKDLREQLDQVKDAGDQAKLAGGIQVLLTQLAEVSDNAGMLDWAGLTMLQLATGLSEKLRFESRCQGTQRRCGEGIHQDARRRTKEQRLP